jgi:hypothetical protein
MKLSLPLDRLDERRRLLAEHLVSFTAGNISRRVEGEPNLIAMTPTSLPYDTMRASDEPLPPARATSQARSSVSAASTRVSPPRSRSRRANSSRS